MLSGTWSANMKADHFLVLGRTIAGRKRGRRFKAAGANETQRVRAGCLVRGINCARRLGFGAKTELCARAELCSDARFWSEKLASRAINFHIHTQEIVGRLSVYTYYIMERIYYICVFI